MSNLFAQHDYALGEPIAALATPFGKSALAIIRLSGDGVIELFKPFFSHPDRLNRHATMSYGFFIDRGGNKVDEIMATAFIAPHSYTGEESIELSTHGNMTIVSQLLTELFASGFRMALPGEFSYRAYLLGKMDLIQAEAVHELIDAKSVVATRSALGRLEGHLSVSLERIYQKTLNLLAPLNAHLDYPDEELPALPLFNVDEELKQLKYLIDHSQSALLLQKGALVVIAGVPNVGKSSLFNHLVQHDRAIVSPIAGATRDYIEHQMEIEGLAITLVDTAGLRIGDNELEQMGIDKSINLLTKADLIIYMVATDDPIITNEVNGFEEKTLWVANKSDLAPAPANFIAVSVVKNQGFDQLREAIKAHLHIDQLNSKKSDLLLGSLRQQQLCQQAYHALNQFNALIAEGTIDELAYQAKIASHALAQLLGKDSDQEATLAMFSQFCLGK